MEEGAGNNDAFETTQSGDPFAGEAMSSLDPFATPPGDPPFSMGEGPTGEAAVDPDPFGSTACFDEAGSVITAAPALPADDPFATGGDPFGGEGTQAFDGFEAAGGLGLDGEGLGAAAAPEPPPDP